MPFHDRTDTAYFERIAPVTTPHRHRSQKHSITTTNFNQHSEPSKFHVQSLMHHQDYVSTLVKSNIGATTVRNTQRRHFHSNVGPNTHKHFKNIHQHLKNIHQHLAEGNAIAHQMKAFSNKKHLLDRTPLNDNPRFLTEKLKSFTSSHHHLTRQHVQETTGKIIGERVNKDFRKLLMLQMLKNILRKKEESRRVFKRDTVSVDSKKLYL